MIPEEIARFLRKCRREDSGCLIWTGARSHRYGSLKIRGKGYRAHRYSYLIFNGPIGDGLEVNHKCRVPICVNPEHLEIVTPAIHKVIDADLMLSGARSGHVSQRGKKKKGNKSGYPGVWLNPKSNKWEGRLGYNGRRFYLGSSIDPESLYLKLRELKTRLDSRSVRNDIR